MKRHYQSRNEGLGHEVVTRLLQSYKTMVHKLYSIQVLEGDNEGGWRGRAGGKIPSRITEEAAERAIRRYIDHRPVKTTQTSKQIIRCKVYIHIHIP